MPFLIKVGVPSLHPHSGHATNQHATIGPREPFGEPVRMPCGAAITSCLELCLRLRRSQGDDFTGVLKSEISECIFCQAQTPHAVIRHRIEARYGPSKWEFHVISHCRQCGAQRRVLNQAPYRT
jgi:hypothetical protein